MATLRLAFLSALVLELAAALATALVAVEVGLRLLAGHIGYETALLVLLLTPEAYLPLRAMGAQFHASTEGTPRPTGSSRSSTAPAAPEPLPGQAGLRGARPPRSAARSDRAGRGVPALPGPGCAGPGSASCSIGPGQHIAVTGPSGARKTRCSVLLLRFAEPTSGQIRSPGRHRPAGDLPVDRPLAASDRLGPAAPVPVRGHRGQQHRARPAGRIPGRYHAGRTAAGARSSSRRCPAARRPARRARRRLSAGQRQRIALARAFLRDAPLLLLDEPVAHLDPITARQIMDTIERLMAGRTVLLVTHRQGWSAAGPAARASRELRLDQGRLVLASGCLGTASEPGALVSTP